MKTTLERSSEKQVPPFSRKDLAVFPQNDHRALGTVDSWARTWATAGALVWAGMAVAARLGVVRIGAIELLFLFAPLVVVPLGMELGRMLGRTNRLEEIARRMQPVGAMLAVLAICLAPGRNAGLLVLGWMLVCLLMAGGGVIRLAGIFRQNRMGKASVAEIAWAFAGIDLAVGGSWLVASRLGMRPMGIQEPIALLTAVHFHFAGFATAMIAAATLAAATLAAATLQSAQTVGEQRWLRLIVWMVVGMPLLVAAGFVISPVLKMGAGLVFSASVAGLAIFVRACGRQAKDATARMLLQVAAGAVFVGMVFSGAYAVADFLGSDVLTIPQMARTHGIFNAVGFCLPGLLGWLVENSERVSTTKAAKLHEGKS